MLRVVFLACARAGRRSFATMRPDWLSRRLATTIIKRSSGGLAALPAGATWRQRGVRELPDELPGEGAQPSRGRHCLVENTDDIVPGKGTPAHSSDSGQPSVHRRQNFRGEHAIARLRRFSNGRGIFGPQAGVSGHATAAACHAGFRSL